MSNIAGTLPSVSMRSEPTNDLSAIRHGALVKGCPRSPYTLSPLTSTSSKLPDLWEEDWFPELAAALEDSALLASGASKQYVPMTAYCGRRGQNSMQHGGKSRVAENREFRVAMMSQTSKARPWIVGAFVLHS
jgi:hypothetical protein